MYESEYKIIQSSRSHQKTHFLLLEESNVGNYGIKGGK